VESKNSAGRMRGEPRTNSAEERPESSLRDERRPKSTPGKKAGHSNLVNVAHKESFS
jgi:hypothetical protein